MIGYFSDCVKDIFTLPEILSHIKRISQKRVSFYFKYVYEFNLARFV